MFEIAEELSYKKRPSRKTAYARIGIVLWYTEEEELNDLYYMSIRLGIEKRCKQQDIQVVNFYNNIESMRHEDLQGIIAVGKFSLKQIDVLTTITENVVFVDSNPDENQYDSIVIDFEKATKTVLNYFMQKGHSKIGYIGGREVFKDQTAEIEDFREKTFKSYMIETNLLDKSSVYMVLIQWRRATN